MAKSTYQKTEQLFDEWNGFKNNRKSGNAVITQTRAMSAKRLLRNMCKMPKKELQKVKRAYTEFI